MSRQLAFVWGYGHYIVFGSLGRPGCRTAAGRGECARRGVVGGGDHGGAGGGRAGRGVSRRDRRAAGTSRTAVGRPPDDGDRRLRPGRGDRRAGQRVGRRPGDAADGCRRGRRSWRPTSSGATSAAGPSGPHLDDAGMACPVAATRDRGTRARRITRCPRTPPSRIVAPRRRGRVGRRVRRGPVARGKGRGTGGRPPRHLAAVRAAGIGHRKRRPAADEERWHPWCRRRPRWERRRRQIGAGRTGTGTGAGTGAAGEGRPHVQQAGAPGPPAELGLPAHARTVLAPVRRVRVPHDQPPRGRVRPGRVPGGHAALGPAPHRGPPASSDRTRRVREETARPATPPTAAAQDRRVGQRGPPRGARGSRRAADERGGDALDERERRRGGAAAEAGGAVDPRRRRP